MKIKSIQKNKNSEYKITFDDNKSIILYDEIILKYQLIFKKEIDEKFMNQLQEENGKLLPYYEAIKFASKKMHSKKEIKDFLANKSLSDEEVENIIEKLEKNLLINDEVFAKAYIQDKMYLSNDGPIKIKKDLLHHDISDTIVSKLIEEIEYDDIYSKLEKIIDKKIRLNTNKSSYYLKQKIIFEMENLGYSLLDIEKILNEKLLDSNSNIILKEYKKIYDKLSKKYDGNTLNYQIYCKLRQKGFSDSEIKKSIKQF